MVNLRTASKDDRPRIASFYAHTQYGQALSEDDILLLAEKNGAICGAVRLSREYGVLVLRGMRIARQHQRQGIGRQLLHKAVEAIQSEVCYCIPHSHLAAFYQQAGFAETDPSEAPRFLAERLARYRADLGLDVILMRKEAEQPARPGLGSAVA